MRTYVEFIVPSKTMPAGSAVVERVMDRDISKLDFPKDAFEFYFFDSPIISEDPYDAQNNQKNCSEFYLIAEKIITSAEARKIRTPKAAKKPKDGIPVSAPKPGQLAPEFIREAVWETKLKQHKYFAVTKSGGIMAVRDDHIVVNAQKEQLYPMPVKPFSAALQEDMQISKPVQLKRPAPKTSGPQ
jgi:hypothetical protein